MIRENKTNKLKLDKINEEKEKDPREGTRNRNPFICTLRSPVEILNWKP